MQIAENHFRIGVLGGAALLMLLLGTMRFCGEFSLPGKPPVPAVSAAEASSIAETIKLSSAAYDNYLKQDVASFGVRQVFAREMSTWAENEDFHETSTCTGIRFHVGAHSVSH
jgi:hypothetical protein